MSFSLRDFPFACLPCSPTQKCPQYHGGSSSQHHPVTPTGTVPSCGSGKVHPSPAESALHPKCGWGKNHPGVTQWENQPSPSLFPHGQMCKNGANPREIPEKALLMAQPELLTGPYPVTEGDILQGWTPHGMLCVVLGTWVGTSSELLAIQRREKPPKECVFIVHTEGVPTSNVLYVPLGCLFVFLKLSFLVGKKLQTEKSKGRNPNTCLHSHRCFSFLSVVCSDFASRTERCVCVCSQPSLIKMTLIPLSRTLGASLWFGENTPSTAPLHFPSGGFVCPQVHPIGQRRDTAFHEDTAASR